jgi:hypothetical protein
VPWKGRQQTRQGLNGWRSFQVEGDGWKEWMKDWKLKAERASSGDGGEKLAVVLECKSGAFGKPLGPWVLGGR